MPFADDLDRPEGPVALADGSLALVEGGRGCVTQIGSDGRTRRTVAVTGEPNGLAVDGDGTFWVADTRPPAVIRLEPDGRFERVLTAFGGEPFVYPNDLCFGPDGLLYVTESGITDEGLAPGGVFRPDWKTAEVDGRVYRIDRVSLEIEQVAGGIRYANGLAFGPDGALYVAETLSGAILRYAPQDGGFGQASVFGNVNDPDKPDVFRGPDGMAFDVDGNLWVAVYGQGDVTVLDPHGEVVRRVETPGPQTTNVCFGLGDSEQIYVTEYERGQLERFDVGVRGLPLCT
ncbi:MAG TPA: SMP-30/gluconolactonase/LRE family protein [Gaiellaceae bacterium]